MFLSIARVYCVKSLVPKEIKSRLKLDIEKLNEANFEIVLNSLNKKEINQEAVINILEEIIKTGKSTYYEQLRKKIPEDVGALMEVPGLGPKKIKRLKEELGIKTLATCSNSIINQKPNINKIKIKRSFLLFILTHYKDNYYHCNHRSQMAYPNSYFGHVSKFHRPLLNKFD